jgi:hypothetical protein
MKGDNINVHIQNEKQRKTTLWEQFQYIIEKSKKEAK